MNSHKINKLANEFEFKLKSTAENGSNAATIANIFLQYESMADPLGVLLSALDIVEQKTMKDFAGNEHVMEVIRKQYSLIESAINGIISEISELDDQIANS